MSGWTPGIEKVLAHVREKRGEWSLRTMPDVGRDAHWLTRRLEDGQGACVLSSLSNLPYPFLRRAIHENGITEEDGGVIAAAADERDPFDPALRAALLEAAGLSEAK